MIITKLRALSLASISSLTSLSFLVLMAISVNAYQGTEPRDVEYEYDALGRLESVVYKGLGSDGTDIKYTYSYDPAGNRTVLLVEGTNDPTVYLQAGFALEGATLKMPVFVSANPRGLVRFNWAVVSGSNHVQVASRSGQFYLSNVDSIGEIGELNLGLVDDAAKQGSYEVVVEISQPENVLIDPLNDRFTSVVQDNDVTYFTIADQQTVEGGDLQFTVNKVSPSGAVAEDITVSFGADGISAGLDLDYRQAKPTSVQFLSGDTSPKVVTVESLSDAELESDEDFWLKASWNAESFPSAYWAVGTIQDGPILDQANFDIESRSFEEDDGGVALVVSRSGPTGRAYDVEFSVVGGTASAGADYSVTTSGALEFGPTDTQKSIAFTLVNDGAPEAGGETIDVQVKWFNPENGEQTGDGTLTIYDPGASPGSGGGSGSGGLGGNNNTGSTEISINPQSPIVTEGQQMVFEVSRSSGSSSTATVDYTLSGSAIAGIDYAGGTSGTLTFYYDNSTKEIVVNTINDIDVVDGDKTLTLTLTGTNNATLGANVSATGTIRDNDVAGNRSPLANPDSGTVNVISEPLIGPGYFGEGTFNVLANDSDLDSGDTISLVSVAPLAGFTGQGTVSVYQGQVFATFRQCGLYKFTYIVEDQHGASASSILSVNATGDGSCPSSGNGGEPQPDPIPVATIANAATVNEGDSLAFPVTLDQSYPAGVQVVWNVTTGAADVATASGVLAFNVNEPLTQNIVLDTIDNGLIDGNKSVTVALSNSSANATIGSPSTATGAINDNDSHPAFSITDAGFQYEGADLVYTVLKPGSSGLTYTVDYSIDLANSEAADINPSSMSGTLTFGPSTSSQTIIIPTVDDSDWEQAETIYVNLSNPTGGATIADGQGYGQIQNNDGTPIINIFNNGVAEDAGSVTMTIFLQGGTQVPVTVNYATADGTAIAGSDYVATSGSVTIQPGVFDATVSIPIINDTEVEPQENFSLNVTSAVNARTVSSGINAANPNKGSNANININSEDVADTPTYSDGPISWSGVCNGSGTTGTEYGSYTRYCTLSPSGTSCGTQSLTASRSCQIPQTNNWSCGSWGSWQGACGGTQTRYRTCTCTQSPSGNSCGSNTESDTRTCNVQTYSNGPVTWGACSSSGTRTGTYTRTCTWSPSGSSCGTSTHSTSGTCTPSYTYSWSTGSWSTWQCSGVGYIAERWRSATCVRSDGATVSGSYCGSSPSTYQTQSDPTLCGGGGF